MILKRKFIPKEAVADENLTAVFFFNHVPTANPV
jgi:hypothetical protein